MRVYLRTLKYLLVVILILFSVIVVAASTSVHLPFVQRYIMTQLQHNFPELEVQIDSATLAWDNTHYTIALRLQNTTWDYNHTNKIEIKEVWLKPLWLSFIKRGYTHSIGIKLVEVNWQATNATENNITIASEFPKALEKILPLKKENLIQQAEKKPISIQNKNNTVDAIKGFYKKHYDFLKMLVMELPEQYVEIPGKFGLHSQLKFRSVTARLGASYETPELLLAGRIAVGAEEAIAKMVVSEEDNGFTTNARIYHIPLKWLSQNTSEFSSNVMVAVNIGAKIEDLERIPDLNFSISSTKGFINSPKHLPHKLSLEDFYTHGVLKDEGKNWQFSSINLLIHNLNLVGSGSLKPEALDLQLQSQTQFNVPQLTACWPYQLAEETRQWIYDHVKVATIRDSNVSIHFPLNDYIPQPDKLREEDIKAQVQIEAAEMQYLPYVPPITNITANLAINAENAEITVTRANFLTSVIHAKSKIGKFSDPKTMLYLSGALEGSAQDAVQIALSHTFKGMTVEPSKIEMLNPIKRAGGNVNTNFAITMELQKGLDITPHVMFKSKITDLAIHGLLGQYDFVAKQMNADFDDGKLNITGVVNSDAQLKAEIQYSLDATKPQDGQSVQLHTTLDAAQLQNMGLDLDDTLKGSVSVSLGVTLADITSATQEAIPVKLDVDLQHAEIKLPALGVNKKIGEHGKLILDFTDYKANAALSGQYHITIPMLISEGTILLDEKKGLHAIENGHTKLRDSSFVFKMLKENGYKVYISGDSLDLSGLDLSQLQDTTKSMAQDIKLDSKLGKIIMHNDQIIHNPTLSIDCDAKMCKKLLLTGNLEEDSKFELTLKNNSIRLASNDAGRALSALGITRNMRDGELLLEGKKPSTKTWSGFHGTVSIKNYYMRRAPLLAKLLTISSITSTAFTGLSDLLENKGIQFKAMSCNLQYQDGVLHIKDYVSRGPVLSMTGDGEIDLYTQFATIKGVVVPENIVNSIIQSIPLVGPQISGGKNSGVIASSYVIRGKISEDLNVQVNPLSVLTPGFLKHIIEF